MDANRHTMTKLFAQLGLPDSPGAIETFVRRHAFASNGYALCHAPFWSDSQRSFLVEEIIKDADWVGVIDELNCQLHHPA